MIFETMTNSNPMDLLGMAVKVQGSNIKVPDGVYSPDFCYCLYECEEFYPVWGGGADWQNDNTTFLFKKQIASDTGVIRIFKNGVEVASISDNTYGVWKSTYTNDPLQYSFIADWNLIYNAFGDGVYEIVNDYTSIGIVQQFTSRKYTLSQFTDADANGWIKFDWIQSGKLEGTDFDFTEGVDFSFKMQGLLSIDKPETIKDSYQLSNRDSKQFRTEQKNKYLFNSKLIQETDLKMLNENLSLADKLEVYDCNLFGTNFRGKELSFLEINKLEDIPNTRKVSLGLTFNDYTQNIIKTNC